MKQRLTLVAFSLLLVSLSSNGYAADLLQVFQQALRADPAWQKVNASQLARQQQTPINRAALLPSLSATSQYATQDTSAAPGVNPTSTSFSLSVTQPLFDIGAWLNYREARLDSRAAQLITAAALQDLMTRTAHVYFAVLQAQDELHYAQANHQAYALLTHQTQLRFRAGLAKTVDVASAQAALAESLAAVVTAENTLTEKESDLQAITGMAYPALSPTKPAIPLIKPQPLKLTRWLAVVDQQNLTVLADRYTAAANKTTIKAQQAGHYPTLSASANYLHSIANSLPDAGGDSRNVTLTLSVPLFAGGKVNAQTQQAAYNYQAQLGQTQLDYRGAIAQAQNSYYGIVNGVRKLVADRAIVKADEQALSSTRLAYRAGLSNTNIASVISAQQALYKAQQTEAADKYSYLMSLLTLKQAAGTLSVADLVQVNAWLQH